MWNTLSPGSDIDGSGGSTPVTGTSLGSATPALRVVDEHVELDLADAGVELVGQRAVAVFPAVHGVAEGRPQGVGCCWGCRW